RGVSDETEVVYNSYRVPVEKKRNDLRNCIGVIVRERVPIIYDDWRKVPLDIKEMLWTHFQEKFNFSLKVKTQLVNEYIPPNPNNLNSLKKPPLEYEGIRKKDWKSFVDKILSEDFQVCLKLC
ncbi:hypothetical protein CISIN_1g037940mg, partial [Citrus sinensis]